MKNCYKKESKETQIMDIHARENKGAFSIPMQYVLNVQRGLDALWILITENINLCTSIQLKNAEIVPMDQDVLKTHMIETMTPIYVTNLSIVRIVHLAKTVLPISNTLLRIKEILNRIRIAILIPHLLPKKIQMINCIESHLIKPRKILIIMILTLAEKNQKKMNNRQPITPKIPLS